MHIKYQQVAGAATPTAIAEIFLARGWAQRIDGGLCLTDSDTFWGSIDRIVGELATIAYFPTLAWFRQYVAQGNVDTAPDSWFEQRAYRIRHPELGDLPDLLRLEEECWIEPLRATEAELRLRIEYNPQGHYLLEMDGQVAGVIYSQRIVDAEVLFQTNFRDVADPTAQSYNRWLSTCCQRCNSTDWVTNYWNFCSNLPPCNRMSKGWWL